MIDRIAYREMLAAATDDSLVQTGLAIWAEFHGRHLTTAEQNRLWGEWCDVTAEMTRRGQSLLIEEVFRLVREQNQRPTKEQTAREFLARSNQEIEARQP